MTFHNYNVSLVSTLNLEVNPATVPPTVYAWPVYIYKSIYIFEESKTLKLL